MLKRFTLKSKAANVLQRIGFPQKKYKVQEELRKIKKEIGSRMDDDNQEFFDLLNQTTQSFYQTLGDSVLGGTDQVNNTFYAGMNQESLYDNAYGEEQPKPQRPVT